MNNAIKICGTPLSWHSSQDKKETNYGCTHSLEKIMLSQKANFQKGTDCIIPFTKHS
jgi:hypothetical protein